MYNHVEYFRKIAINVVAIQHTDEAFKFSRCSGISNLEELLSSLSKIKFPHLVAFDTREGTYTDQLSDDVVDRKYFSFGLFKHVKNGDHDQLEQSRVDIESIVKTIIGKMRHDKQNEKNGLRDLKMNSISYREAGPIGDNCWGMIVSFNMEEMPGRIKTAQLETLLLNNF